MLTKKMKFDDEVLAVIRNMEWTNEGRLARIIGQLDRPLYVKVNKALEAMGGQWNRKSGGHVFLNDPRSLVEGLLDNGTLTVVRDGFFETPPDVVEQMLQLVWPKAGEKILEPSAGLGAIANLLPVIIKSDIVCIERDPTRCEVLRTKGYHVICADFLATNLTERF